MYSVNFTCNKANTNRAGTNRIQLWVNVDGERSALYLDLRADPNEFKKAIFSRKSNHINRYCSEIRRKIDEYYTDCSIRGLQVRASMLTDYVRNGYEERQYTVYGLFEDFSRLIKKRVGAEIGSSTYRKYLLAIAQFKRIIPDKPLRAVDNTDILNYKYHLKNEVKLKDSTLASYLTKMKSIFVHAQRNHKIERNPFEGIKFRKGVANIVPLTKDELMRIANKDFGIDRLNQVRDLFVFAANTALSYCDLAAVKREDIQTDGDVMYLKKKRGKTGVTYILPLNDTAIGLLKKYDYELPVISNQRYNSYLKEIADICGIRKTLTTHLARHTAATLMLNAGLSIEVVSKILGHSNTKMTQHYAKLLDKTVINTKIEF
jgi:integrase